PGYGGALLAGFAATSAPWIVTMDADLSHPPTFIGDFWRRRGEAELLIASRFVPGGEAETSAFRLILSRVLNGTFRVILSLPVHDLSSGFRCYRREMLEGLHPAARDFDFLQEVLIRLHNGGARILEIPFHYRPRGAGRSHARLLRFGWAYAKTLARMWRLRRGI
ncbi:MAG TPA: glycosyltransferase, partial [Longimicrobiales bacterium]